MIEKLDVNDYRQDILIDKINELIEEYNKMENHTHKVQDSYSAVFTTTTPIPDEEL